MTLGDKIRILRLTKGLSQKKLAELTGIPQTTISDFERNKYKPDLERLQKLARFFEMTLDELLSFPNDKSA